MRSSWSVFCLASGTSKPTRLNRSISSRTLSATFFLSIIAFSFILMSGSMRIAS